ncbi:MAG: methionine--tRNA ligase [Deltaproteobacteria bacterium]|nr:methionine--tRNA ligase [Deltaproteobacteria bacterium]
MKNKCDCSGSQERYYVTTPIYYANGHPHLGNTYSTTLADSLTRFNRFLGKEAFFLTGTDEHGDKVYQAALAANKTPLDFTNEVSDLFKSTWKELGLEYSRFIRTTEPEHKRVVQMILSRIYEKGDIYFGDYGGLYCVGCERFLTDKELVDGKCPDHQVEPKYVSEKNYFFRMSKYQESLIEHITKVAPDFIRPTRYMNEVLALLREPLEDLCISRPKSRLTWGIELPFDSNYVTYVWFDALINYLSGVDYPDGDNFRKFWPVSEHITAKDIVKPHGVFWPTMLMAADIPLYRHLNVHGYWVTPTGKMSKSLGNVVDPLAIKERHGMDVFRYYVFREMVFGLDGTFSMPSLETRYNADLANNLGNLVSRSLAMVHRYRKGEVPESKLEDPMDLELKDHALACIGRVKEAVQAMEIHRALEHIWVLIDAVNVYIDRTKPWILAKGQGDVSSKIRLDNVLYVQLETIRVIAGLLTAFMPDTSVKILNLLGFRGEEIKAEQDWRAVSEWGRLRSKTFVNEAEILFPRLEDEAKVKSHSKEEFKLEQSTVNTAASPSETSNFVSYDDFSKVSLRVGQILEAERVIKSDKLLKLSVDLGELSGPRQVIAGIGKSYQAEELIGRKVAVVANLNPRKIMGLESYGMLLATSDAMGKLHLLEIDEAVSPGSSIG